MRPALLAAVIAATFLAPVSSASGEPFCLEVDPIRVGPVGPYDPPDVCVL